MGLNVTSGIAFLVAITGFVVAHHDLLHKFVRTKAKIFLLVLGPVIGLWGVWSVIGALAETSSISPVTYGLNLALGFLGSYVIAFRPFRNGSNMMPFRGVRGAK